MLSLPSLSSSSSQQTLAGFIPPHGGYKKLLSDQKAEIVYDATVHFCGRFFNKRDRTYDQMVQAARSGKQNIVEGSQASGTSKEMEIKLTSVARASLEDCSPITAIFSARATSSNGLPIIAMPNGFARSTARPAQLMTLSDEASNIPIPPFAPMSYSD